MQQIDHDAWEEGYGRDSGAVNQEHIKLELQAMYEALARRQVEEKAQEKSDLSTNNKEQ